MNLILMYAEHIGSSIATLAEEVRHLASTVVKNPTITFRVKDADTLRKKMLLKGVESIFSIDDVYAMRILVDSIDDVYLVLKKIQGVFLGHLDHDYIKTPMSRPSVNGKKLRLVQFIAHKNDVPFEIQITTNTFNEVNKQLHKGYHSRKYH